MNDPLDKTTARWSPMTLGGVAAGGLVLLLLLLPTCDGPTPEPEVSQDDTAAEDASLAQCERTLVSVLDGLQPDRLGLTAEGRVMVDTLNNWRKQCSSDLATFNDDASRQLLDQLLDDTASGRAHVERYQSLDADHVRNGLLAKSIVGHVVADSTNDLDRAVELFFFVVRTIELIPDGVVDVPLTPYESLLFGAGTAADRAWVYALLLRQLRLDCVMLQPRTTEETPYWLIGVVIPGDGVRLFDLRLGLPIMASEAVADPQPGQPTTLAEARVDDSLLRQFDQKDAAYPLSADKLSTVDVFAIGTSSTWAPRMGALQAALPEAPELFDGLAANPLRTTGLIDRLVAAGRDGLWSAEQVHVWPFPETRWIPADELTDEQRQRLAGRLQLFDGPFSVAAEPNEVGELTPVISRPQRSLRHARISQLMGQFEPAQQVYLQARLSQQPLPPEQMQQVPAAHQAELARVLHVNYFAADMATYWAAQCQFEQHDYRVAAQSALNYLKRPGGQFVLPALYLASFSLAHEGRGEDAAAVLSQEPPQAAQHLGNLKLASLWRTPATGAPQPPPTSDKPAPPDKAATEDEPPADATKPTDGTDTKPSDNTQADNTQADEAADAAAPPSAKPAPDTSSNE